VVDFEHETGVIAEILENVDEARVQFEVRTSTTHQRCNLESLVVSAVHRDANIQDDLRDCREP
jgi:hypothetical protein